MHAIHHERLNTRMHVIAGSRLLNNNDKPALSACAIHHSSVLDSTLLQVHVCKGECIASFHVVYSPAVVFPLSQ